MNHEEARIILDDSDAEISLDEESGVAELHGNFNIEELQAILQLLEYNS